MSKKKKEEFHSVPSLTIGASDPQIEINENRINELEKRVKKLEEKLEELENNIDNGVIWYKNPSDK